ncbi:MAG: hypothetical protein M0T79_00535, partial [Actinomycetota bacterium]|nr:hypothetical protein [Actinomycetota bacterium]
RQWAAGEAEEAEANPGLAGALAEADAIVEMVEEDEVLEEAAEELELSAGDEVEYPDVSAEAAVDPSGEEV